MNKILKTFIFAFVAQLFLISCDTDNTSSPSNIIGNSSTNVVPSINLQKAEISIAQSQNGTILTFTAVSSQALKDRTLFYTWIADFQYDESLNMSMDGKYFSIDISKLPENIYTVTLYVEDKTELPSELEEDCDNSEIQYTAQTTFSIKKD